MAGFRGVSTPWVPLMTHFRRHERYPRSVLQKPVSSAMSILFHYSMIQTHTKNMKLSSFFNHRLCNHLLYTSRNVLNYLKFNVTIWKFPKLFESFWICLKVSGAIWKFLELTASFWNYLKGLGLSLSLLSYLKVSETVWNILKPFESFWNYLKVSGANLKSLELFKSL